MGVIMTAVQIKVPNWLDRIFVWPVLLYRKYKFGWPFRRIYLGEGIFTIVSPPDYYKYNIFNWCLNRDGRNMYAVRVVTVNDVGRRSIKIIALHREILKVPPGMLVDHRNNNSLDNRMDNLRIATHAQNNCNRRKTSSNTSSQFIGVCFYKRHNRWAVNISHKGKKIFLGYFDTETDAARAYDEAARKYHKEFARLNFP